jgi:hypothetical protein
VQAVRDHLETPAPAVKPDRRQDLADGSDVQLAELQDSAKPSDRCPDASRYEGLAGAMPARHPVLGFAQDEILKQHVLVLG